MNFGVFMFFDLTGLELVFGGGDTYEAWAFSFVVFFLVYIAGHWSF